MIWYIIVILSFFLILDLAVSYLNIRAATPELPSEFIDIYDVNRYKKSQIYLKETTKFSNLSSIISFLGLAFILAFNVFNELDLYLRTFQLPELTTGLIFMGVLFLTSTIVGIPFSVYSTFVIESKYGFNTTTIKTFISDKIKGLILTLIIGTPVLSVILILFNTYSKFAWLYCWIFITIFQLIMMIVAPTLIMPLFNKFESLEEGDLKNKIQEYAKNENFKLNGIFTMDGSKRSKKSNAFFTGFGSFKRIVLFDTLIKNHSVKELLVILAHEMGHYKHKHIQNMILKSICLTGITFYLLSFTLNHSLMFELFNITTPSVYVGLVIFSIIYSPIQEILGTLDNIFSRKQEYEADAYAIKTTHLKEEFILALKKLSCDNLSNLTPHKLHVFLHYSHPPVLKRIEAIRDKFDGVS